MKPKGKAQDSAEAVRVQRAAERARELLGKPVEPRRTARILLSLTDEEHARLAAVAAAVDEPLAVFTRRLALLKLSELEQG